MSESLVSKTILVRGVPGDVVEKLDRLAGTSFWSREGAVKAVLSAFTRGQLELTDEGRKNFGVVPAEEAADDSGRDIAAPSEKEQGRSHLFIRPSGSNDPENSHITEDPPFIGKPVGCEPSSSSTNLNRGHQSGETLCSILPAADAAGATPIQDSHEGKGAAE